jgi:hypothetical protein
MQTAEKLGVGVTLFTDILGAERYEEWDLEAFYLPYKQQLNRALKNGHDVQLHIHPHWLTSNYKDEKFVPSNDFCLADFKSDATFGGIKGIVNRAATKLRSICRESDSAYNCIAYRAGGFNLQPCTSEILEALESVGILYDSSIAKGYYFKSDISEVDYRNMPKQSNWYLNPTNIHIEAVGRGMLEIPIAAKPKSIFEIPTAFKMKKYRNRAPQQHGSVIHSGSKIELSAKFKMLFASRMLSFDNYTVSSSYLFNILEYNIKNHKSDNDLLLSVISHPKSMGSYSFKLMERFILDVKQHYPNAEFVTYKDLFKQNENQQITL